MKNKSNNNNEINFFNNEFDNENINSNFSDIDKISPASFFEIFKSKIDKEFEKVKSFMQKSFIDENKKNVKVNIKIQSQLKSEKINEPEFDISEIIKEKFGIVNEKESNDNISEKKDKLDETTLSEENESFQNKDKNNKKKKRTELDYSLYEKIIMLYAQGKKIPQIARELHISQNLVIKALEKEHRFSAGKRKINELIKPLLEEEHKSMLIYDYKALSLLFSILITKILRLLQTEDYDIKDLSQLLAILLKLKFSTYDLLQNTEKEIMEKLKIENITEEKTSQIQKGIFLPASMIDYDDLNSILNFEEKENIDFSKS